MCVVASHFLSPIRRRLHVTIRASDEKLPSSEIILFTPADIAAPPEAVQSLQNIANRAETFFASWLTRWGYLPHRQKIFSRGENGCVLVRTVSGDRPLSSGAYDNWQSLAKNRLQVKICDATVGQYSIPRNGNYFWIFVWLGPDRRYTDWRGSGGPRHGGHCVVRYPNGGDFSRPKTYIHEFGHALGLPHVGPRIQDTGYCSLMGPNDRTYRRKWDVTTLTSIRRPPRRRCSGDIQCSPGRLRIASSFQAESFSPNTRLNSTAPQERSRWGESFALILDVTAWW